MQARGSGGAPALHTGGQEARARVRACSHCDRSVSPRHRRSPRGGCLLAAQRHSDAQHACTWRSIHAAGARRSRATGSSQRAGELTGADPANRAPLAHPRQLAGRSWPRIRRRGARFGDGLETDHLNGRPGGREATRCAVRPLRGAGDTTATLGGGPYIVYVSPPPVFAHLQFCILPRALRPRETPKTTFAKRLTPTSSNLPPFHPDHTLTS
jgi:hypothetical protein